VPGDEPQWDATEAILTVLECFAEMIGQIRLAPLRLRRRMGLHARYMSSGRQMAPACHLRESPACCGTDLEMWAVSCAWALFTESLLRQSARVGCHAETVCSRSQRKQWSHAIDGWSASVLSAMAISLRLSRRRYIFASGRRTAALFYRRDWAPVSADKWCWHRWDEKVGLRGRKQTGCVQISRRLYQGQSVDEIMDRDERQWDKAIW